MNKKKINALLNFLRKNYMYNIHFVTLMEDEILLLIKLLEIVNDCFYTIQSITMKEDRKGKR